MRVISRKKLKQVWEEHPDARQPLQAWYADATYARWRTPADIRNTYCYTSFVADNRVIFNIKGNTYRLVGDVHYTYDLIYLQFAGISQAWVQIEAATGEAGVDFIEIKPVKTENDYRVVLAEIERLFGADPGTPEGDRLEVLATLAEAYEEKHHRISFPDPIETIKYYMESRNLSRRDLEPYLGSRARVSEILNKKRPLSLQMIRKLHSELGIPAEILIKPYEHSRDQLKPDHHNLYVRRRRNYVSPR